jgi:hypothetical protein
MVRIITENNIFFFSMSIQAPPVPAANLNCGANVVLCQGVVSVSWTAGGTGFVDGNQITIDLSGGAPGSPVTAATYPTLTLAAGDIGSSGELLANTVNADTIGSGYAGSVTAALDVVSGAGNPAGGTTAVTTTVNFGPNTAVCTPFQICLRGGPTYNNDCYTQRSLRCIAKTFITGKSAASG